MPTPPANANGHRRRQLRARVLAEETHCALCGQRVDKTLGMQPGAHGPRCRGGNCAGCIPHDMRAEVDEDIPRSRGGSAYERTNTALMHRACNRAKGPLTINEYRARQTGQASKQNGTSITNLVAW